MIKKNLLLIGAGGHAKSCIEVIEECGEFKISGIIGLPGEVGKKILGYDVIGSDDDLLVLSTSHQHALIALGQVHTPKYRIGLYESLVGFGYQLPTIVSPKAKVSRHAIIGDGTIIMHGTVINACVKIGINCIINSLSLIEHDVFVGDHCHISTGVILNGNSSVGRGSFMGSRSVVKDGVSIGSECIIGMGVCVRKNLLNSSTYTGD